MRRRNPIHPNAHAHRGTLRTLGMLLVLVGGIFTAVGMVSFFSAIGGGGPPQLFWCVFVGMPLLGFGAMMLKFAYFGAVARYIAAEAAPVASDTVNYMADRTSGGVEKLVAAVRRGLDDERGDATTRATVAHCPGCGAANDATARFCDQCGTAMPRDVVCGSCHQQNDPDARFCNHCGAAIA